MKAIVIIGLALLMTGCQMPLKTCEKAENARFNRLFSWNAPIREEDFERCAMAGVTDIVVRRQKQYDLAKKYGMTPYWGCYTPAGPHRQVMRPEEEKYFSYINCLDMDRKDPARKQELHRRRQKLKNQYGGESDAEIETLNNVAIPCFLSDEGLALAKKKLEGILKDAPPDNAGIFLDYFGYMNFHGCYCEECLRRYGEHLQTNKLEDSQKNKDEFYLLQLIGYYDRIIGYIKGKHPEYKIVAHFYPDFKPYHLFGNRTKVDYCGQTVAWYFRWPPDKIRQYTQYVIGHAKDNYPFAEGIPFVGLNTDASSSLGYKSPAELEQELKMVLDAGGRTLMICNGLGIIAPGYFEVFRKYCGRK